MPAKTCFIISPIGPDDSDTRKSADDLMELVIQPALEKYRFVVVRADKIPKTAVITADIVELVQNSELCVIDLTGQNANVFYECGRRHETGKPFIQLLRKNEHLPFDVAGIRTVIYDLSSPRSVLDAIKTVQSFVDEFEKTGYTTTSSGASLSTVAEAVARIERRLSSLATSGLTPPSSGAGAVDAGATAIDWLRPPREIFLDAVRGGDIDKAAAVLKRLRNIEKTEFLAAAGILASAGNEVGSNELLDYVETHFAELDYEAFRIAIGALGRFYSATDREREGLSHFKKYIGEFIRLHKVSPDEEAYLLNQLQKLEFGAGEYPDALELSLKVLELAPNDLSYIYNASTVYRKLEQPKRAEAMVDRYMAIDGVDEDHLSHAVRVYIEAGNVDKAKKAYARLLTISPGRARELIAFDEDIRRALQ